MPQHAVRSGPPGEVDLALLDFHQPPLARKLEVGPMEPPDIIAARVDELELELVHGRVGAQVERDFVVRRQIDRQDASRGRVPGRAAEIEVQPQRGARRPGGGMHRRAHAIGHRGLPCLGGLEAIEDSYR